MRRNLPSIVKLLTLSPLLVKFIRANLCLPFIHKHLPRTKIVLIVRNPWAVVASQVRHPEGAWQHVVQIASFYQPVIERYPQLAPPPSLTTKEEALAAQWCIEHAYLEQQLPNLTGVHLLRYEDLYHAPAMLLKQVIEYLELPWDNHYLAYLNQRSSSVACGSALLRGKDPTTQYKDVLSEEQQQRIAAIVDHYGAPFEA
jgi:hypothetical protein